VLNLVAMISTAEITPYIKLGQLHFSAKTREMRERGARASIAYSGRSCLRNPPPLGRVILTLRRLGKTHGGIQSCGKTRLTKAL